MKILFLSHRVPYPPNKGEKIRTYYQIEYLASLGYKIDVLSPLESDEDSASAKALSQKLQVCAEGKALGFKVLRLIKGFIRRESLSEANFYSTELQKHIDEKIKTEAYNWLICTSSSMAKYVFRSSSLQDSNTARPGLIMDFMDLDSDKWKQYTKLKSFPLKLVYERESRLVANLEARIQKQFDACLFISENEVNLFKSVVGEHNNSLTVANGLDTNTFFPAERNASQEISDPTFIFTGVMDYFPNEDAVLWFCEAMWPAIKQKHPNSTFYIAGMNPSSKVQKLAEKPGIKVTGFVDDIVEYYHRADIFIAPFRLARGVQNKVLQAFACGLPVVTTACGAEGISCENNKHLLIADSENDFINAVERLIDSAELRKSLAEQALKLIQDKYSWSGRLAPLKQIIDQSQAKDS